MAVSVAAVLMPLVLAVVGCGTTDHTDKSSADKTTSGGQRTTSPTTSPTPTIPADPKEALVASVKELALGNFRFTSKDVDSSYSGQIHLPSHTAAVTVKATDASIPLDLTMDGILTQQESWFKITMSNAQVAAAMSIPTDKWLHIDPAKLNDRSDGSLDFTSPDTVDPGDSTEIVRSLVTAQQTGPGRYSGTTDLSQLKKGDLIDDETVTALADKAKALPFTAVLDDKGRLTSMAVEVPAAGENPAFTATVTYSDFGAAAQTQLPAQAEEAPEAFYQAFLNED